MEKVRVDLGLGPTKIIHHKTVDKDWILIGIGYALVIISLVIGGFV
jgi:hypothetical protein